VSGSSLFAGQHPPEILEGSDQAVLCVLDTTCCMVFSCQSRVGPHPQSYQPPVVENPAGWISYHRQYSVRTLVRKNDVLGVMKILFFFFLFFLRPHSDGKGRIDKDDKSIFTSYALFTSNFLS